MPDFLESLGLDVYAITDADTDEAHTFTTVRTFTGATMFVFEALVSQKAKALVADAAIHFTSRDRSQIADQVIVPRLKVLGLI